MLIVSSLLVLLSVVQTFNMSRGVQQDLMFQQHRQLQQEELFVPDSDIIDVNASVPPLCERENERTQPRASRWAQFLVCFLLLSLCCMLSLLLLWQDDPHEAMQTQQNWTHDIDTVATDVDLEAREQAGASRASKGSRYASSRGKNRSSKLRTEPQDADLGQAALASDDSYIQPQVQPETRAYVSRDVHNFDGSFAFALDSSPPPPHKRARVSPSSESHAIAELGAPVTVKPAVLHLTSSSSAPSDQLSASGFGFDSEFSLRPQPLQRSPAIPAATKHSSKWSQFLDDDKV